VLWDDTQFKLTRFKYGNILQRVDTEIPNDTLLVDFDCAVTTFGSSVVYCLWEGTRIEGLYYYTYLFCSSSLDSGATFSTTVRVDTNEIIVPTGGSGQGFPEAIVDSTGNLLVVYAKGVDLNNTMLLLGRSSNQGASFISPTAVCSNGQNSHPDLSIDSLGGVDFGWADYNGVAHHTRSTDGGSTFSTIQAIGVGYPKIRSGRGGDLFAALFTSARIYFTRADLISGVGPAEGQAGSYELFQNYPNPFNPTTTINYDLPVDARVTLKVYDVLGREVATLVDGFVEAGYRQAHVNAASLASGVYFYRLNAGPYTDTKKLVVLK
jgi:hypothetical protein